MRWQELETPLPNQHRAVVGAAGEEQQVEKVPPYDYAIDLAAAKEVATAIRGAVISAKLALIPVRRGYWGNKISPPHTVPTKLTAKCGSVLFFIFDAVAALLCGPVLFFVVRRGGSSALRLRPLLHF